MHPKDADLGLHGLPRTVCPKTVSLRYVTEFSVLLQKHLGAAMIGAGAQLVELDLSDNAFGPNGVEGIVDLLESKTCYTLKELRLNNNGLGTTGGKVFSFYVMLLFEPQHDKTNNMVCAPSEDSDQPGPPLSLIGVFAVHTMGSKGLNVSSCGQQRLCSDWADAQAGLSIRWMHWSFCWFCYEAAHLLCWIASTANNNTETEIYWFIVAVNSYLWQNLRICIIVGTTIKALENIVCFFLNKTWWTVSPHC